MTDTAPVINATNLGCSLTCKDLEAAIRFYRDAIGFAVASGWYFLSGLAPNTGADIDTAPERVSAAAVGVAILLRAIGVALYLGWPSGWMRRFVLLCCLPALASIAWLAVGGVLSHRAFHVAGLLPYLGVALLAFERARQEPGNAHGLFVVDARFDRHREAFVRVFGEAQLQVLLDRPRPAEIAGRGDPELLVQYDALLKTGLAMVEALSSVARLMSSPAVTAQAARR